MFLFQLSIIFFLYNLRLEASTVLDLTDKNFHKQTTIHSNLLLLFYGSRCHYCSKLEPEYEKASQILSSDQPPRGVLARINCTGPGIDTCRKSNILSVPTIKLYKNGVYVKDYAYSRIAWSLVKFVRAQSGPSSHELRSIEDFRQFLLVQRDAFLVGFFADHSKMMRAFFRLSEQLKETLVFAHSHCENLLRRQKVYDGIVLFRPVRYYNQYEEDRVLYTGRPVVGEIKTFLLTSYHGLVGRRTPFNVHDFNYPLVVLYYNSNPENGLNEPYYWRMRLLPVAKNYKSIVAFAVSDKDDFDQELETFGGFHTNDNSSIKKPLVVAWSLDAEKYKMVAEMTTANLDRFVSDLVDGRLKTYVKSRPIPKSKDGEVVVVVADNFDEVVLNNDLDTLLAIYVPWCSHSQQLVPIYRELADKLKSEEVAVVKMDASGNDILTEFETKEFPTIYWLAKNNKREIVVYRGKRSLDELLLFVARKATAELKGFDRKGRPKEADLQKTEL